MLLLDIVHNPWMFSHEPHFVLPIIVVVAKGENKKMVSPIFVTIHAAWLLLTFMMPTFKFKKRVSECTTMYGYLGIVNYN